MRKFIFGIIIGTLLICSVSYAYRIGKPVPIIEINPNTLVELNQTLDEIWNVLNGRYNMNYVTDDPDGSAGDTGDFVLYYDGANYFLEINVDGGTTWLGEQLSNTH